MKFNEKENMLKMKLQLLADGQGEEGEGEVSNPEGEKEGDKKEPPKTFSQEELDEIISKRVARETAKLAKQQEETIKAQLEAERQESEKLAKMNEADRARALAEKRETELQEREAKLLAKEKELEEARLLNISKDMLAERKLSVEFANMVNATVDGERNAETIKKNIDVFKKNFDAAVEAVVAERMKSGAPRSIKISGSDISKDDFKKMTLAERTALYNENKDLYMELSKR